MRTPAAAWLGLAALAALGWREGLAFALSNGGASNVEQIFFEAAENPPWLITAVAAALLVGRRHELREALGEPGSAWRSALLLGPGLAFLAWGRFVGAPDLALIGTVAMALGAAYASGGGRLLRFLAVPLGILAFAIPVPAALVNQVVYPLQLRTADYAAALLRLLPISALHQADVIRTPGHNFLVIEGCSGLGSMEVLTFLAVAWSWATRTTLRQGLVLVLAAPAIAYGLNGLRVVSLVLYPESGVWSIHTLQGIVAFALGALSIALLDRWVVRRGEAPQPETPAPAPARHPSRTLAAWAVAAALVSLAVPRYEVPVPPERGPLVPDSLAPWSGEEVTTDTLYLGSVRFDRAVRRLYRLEDDAREKALLGSEPVTLFVAEDALPSGATSLLSRKLEVPGRGWLAVGRRRQELPGRYVAERVVSRGDARSALDYTVYLGLGSPAEEALRAFLGLDRSPFHRAERAQVIQLTTEIGDGPGAETFADRRLADLFTRLEPRLAALRQSGAGAPREAR